jgi:hypothetical protein
MTLALGTVPAGTTLYIPFSTYAGSTGASVTLTGLAVTDIEIYKNGSTTQRASDAGYALLDTDGIDFDGITGIHGFSIDLSDNTDSGFYAVGSTYWVVVSAVTVDSQTVNFIAAHFRIGPAESVTGYQSVNVSHFGGTAGTFSGGRPEVNTTHAAGTAWGSGAITSATFAADAITAAKLAADVTTELQSGLATAAALSTVDTVVDAIKAVTDLLPDAGALTSLATAAALATVDSNVDAILDDTGTSGVVVADKTGFSLSSTGLNLIVMSDISAVPAMTAALPLAVNWIFAQARNKVDTTSSENRVYKDDGSTVLGTAALSDDGTTAVRGEYA